MPLPELEAKRVEVELKRFAERVPPHARSQIWYKHLVRGNTVTLIECRPYFQDATQTTEQPIARFRFDPATVTWSLLSPDRNDRWHAYEGFKNVRGFATVLTEVECDPRAVFFG